MSDWKVGSLIILFTGGNPGSADLFYLQKKKLYVFDVKINFNFNTT